MNKLPAQLTTGDRFELGPLGKVVEVVQDIKVAIIYDNARILVKDTVSGNRMNAVLDPNTPVECI